MTLRRRQTLLPYVLLAPGLLWLIVFYLYPALTQGYVSLQEGNFEQGYSFTWNWSVYGDALEVSERHRHRYEVNTAYKDRLEQHGLRFSGLSPDGVLPEIVEYEDHPWFIGVQYHPELKSRPFEPHPLFASFIQAAVVQSRLV